MKSFLTAHEATKVLGISRATLYAYVSRGLIRSEEADAGKRTRRYHAEDVDRLRRRQEQRRDPDQSAAETLNWGVPLIDSALTRIADGRCYYRGHDVVDLAATRTVEEVASLLWTGHFYRWDSLTSRVSLPDRFIMMGTQLAGLPPYDLLRILLPLAAVRDRGAVDLRPAAVASTGRRIMSVMTLILAGELPSMGIASTLAKRLAQVNGSREELGAMPAALGGDVSEHLISAALIVCADHELNASSFTARCVASTMANPYGVVEAGLAALSGYKHGGMGERVEILLADCAGASDVAGLLHDRLRRGEGLPGFGHNLYPDGDPRGRLLLDQLRRAGFTDPVAESVEQAVFDLTGERPNVDYGLVAVTRAMRMPPGSALTLFALGRTIGWIGHAIEEYQKDRLIRPRARYVGPVTNADHVAAPVDNRPGGAQ